MQNKREKRGISLIVLVITIIVMIILAAAIIISLNNTGIISNANTAKTKTDDKQIREAIEVAKLNLNFEGGINESNLKTELQKSLGVDVEVINNMDKSYTIKVKDMYYTLEEDETVISGIYDKWDKTSTEPTQITTNEIHIYKASELKWLQEEVEKGNFNLFEGYKIYLENNLDFGARENAGTTLDEKWETTSNKEYKWTPIAKEKGKELKAEFDGKEHIIKGIYVEETTNFSGIFGGSQAPIKNLTIKNSYIKGTNCTAGIVGVGREGCIISNCHNINTTVVLTSGDNSVASGIVGQVTSDVIDCTNSGNIISYGKSVNGYSFTAGIIGSTVTSSNGKVENCINYGKIESNSNGALVAGIISKVAENVTVNNCINKGQVKSNGTQIGAIAGCAFNTVSRCINYGEVICAQDMCGGIVGCIANHAEVLECANYGNITGVGTQVGGITGLVGTSSADISPTAKIDKCFNVGNIKGNESVGGIIGLLIFDTASVTNCYSKGIVTGNNLTGSVVGKYEKGNIKHLYYPNTLSIKAVGNTDYADKNVTSTTKNINSFEEFKTWISQFE